MNQDTGWFNSYDKCGPDQRNHPPPRYNNAATMPQPPRWDPLCLPPPVGIGHNIQSLHPYAGGFVPNQFHPAYTPRPMGSYQTYMQPKPSYNNYRNNQNPRMRQGNNRWQRRNGQDRSRNNYQHSNPGPSKQEPQIQEIEQTIPPPVETQLDKRPATTVSPASVHIIEDNNDNVGADKRKIKEEDKKLLMECIDLSAETDSPEEALNRFEFESRTKILDKLCGTTDEAKFIEGLKQFKMILKDQMCGIRLKNQLSKMLLKYILFLGMNYKSLASGFIEEYLDLMEDIIAMFCQVVTDIINLRLADNKRTLNDVFASQIKQLISCALLCRLDSIMHCLFKVHIPPLLKDHSALWTDVFLYFLRKSKFDPKHDDLLRLFIAWKRLLSVRASKDAEIINGYMFECLKKTPEELKSIPYLKEFMENYHDNPRCNWQEMLSKYWKWWKEERPEQLWAGLEEPTYIQLHGTFNLEYQPTNNVFTNHSKTQDDEFSKLFEDRLTGKTLGLTQLGRRMPYGRQNNLFCQSTSGNIFDEATCINIDFDYYDDNDLIIAEPKVVETVVVDSDDDDDDVVFIEEESTAKEVVEKTTEAVEELNINDLNENIFEDDSNKVDEELILNSKTSLEVEVQPDNEASENNPKETDDSKSNVAVEEIISNYHEASKNNPKETAESKNNVVVEEICDNFIKNYPEDIDDDDDSVDFPEIIIESERNQDNLPSNAMTLDEIFDEWEETFDDIGPEMERNEDRTLMFADPLNEGEGNDPFKSPLHSPEECNDKDNTEKTCDEFSKTETVSSQKEIVPEKRTDSIPDDIEELPNQQQELESIAETPVSTNQQQETIAETSASSKHNGLLSILCMQDLRQVLNEMEQDDRKLQEKLNEEKNVCLTEVPAAIEENVIEQQLTDEEDNLDKSHNYAAIVQAACSDDDNNEFASKGLNLFEHQSDATNDSDEISSPPFEPLDSNEAHVDSENESFEKERRFEAIGETLATASTEPVISPAVSGTLATASTEPCQPDTNESCQTVIKADEVLNETSTELAGAESTSTTAINLASPCGDNSDNITIHCRFVLKQEVQPDFAAMHENYELEKYADYPLEVPQRPNSPPQSGSQPYSPPSIRIGNTGSALDETSTMLYTPILQDSHKIQPAIVPDVLPQQDLPNHNVVPPEPSVENKLVDTIKILKVHNVVETPSSSSFGKESDDTYIVVRNSQTTEAETPEKPKKRSRKSSTTKDSVKSKKRESDSSRVRKSSRALQDGVKKASKEKLMKPLSPQDNGLFEYAFEGPTGKPLWNTTPNMLWDDSEDHPEAQKTTVLVKSDKQLVSILKKPKLDKQIKDYNQPRLFGESVSKNEATKKTSDSLHYPLSNSIASPSTNNFINNTSLSQTDFYSNLHYQSQVYLSADNPKLTPASPFLPEEMLESNSKKLEEQPTVLMPEQYQEPYLSLSKTLFGDSLPPNDTSLEMQKIPEEIPINNNFNVYELEKQSASIFPNPNETYPNQYYIPAVPFYQPEITQNPDIKTPETPSIVYQAPQALPQTPTTLLDNKVSSNYFVKAQLPPKKRKLTEEDELAYYLQKLKEEKEPKPKLEENISYPAQRQMSIADVQRDFPKGVVKTLAARKIYPGDPSIYPDSEYYEYPPGYDQFNDFNNKRSIMNVYINGVRDYSAKYPFCLMIGMGTAGQPAAETNANEETPEVPLNCQVPVCNNTTPNVQKPVIEEAPVAQPRAKRSKKTESVVSETPAPPKRGRGRPRKNPII